jgi:hypothetical protein
MATASKLNFPPIIYVTVPPAQDVPNAVYNQEIVFESMSQQYTICFATNSQWPSISGKSFSNQTRTSITTPSVDTSIDYNVVTSGPCVAAADAVHTIHVSSTGKK